MNFANIKAFVIPEGSVRSVSAGGKVLWQQKQGYTNLIPAATATPDGTEIYNGLGYKDGYRWSSSAKAETAHEKGRISGWIPFVSGATYRIKHFYISTTSGYADGGYLVFCDKFGNVTAAVIERANPNYDATTDTLVWSEENASRMYFRISAYKGSEAPIVTMDEEIPL